MSISFATFFDGNEAPKQAMELARWYALVAEQFHCEFLNATELVSGGEADQLHLSPESHQKLAEALRDKIKSIMESEAMA